MIILRRVLCVLDDNIMSLPARTFGCLSRRIKGNPKILNCSVSVSYKIYT